MATGNQPLTADNDLGLFGPGSVTWRVHAEPVLIVGGVRALYLQSLHPRAIAGVMQNSGFRRDPWGRFVRTVEYVATTVYGTTAQAERAGARVRAVHARMTAVDPRTGQPFRIDEPDLLRWVHVTEMESFLTTARRAGAPISDADADRYYLEQSRAAALVGLDPAGVPTSVAEVDEYYRAIRGELAMTRDSAEAFGFLSFPPLPWQLELTPVRLMYGAVAALAVGLLPPWARRLYGLPALPTTDLSASLSARTLRLSLRMLPRKLFEGPLYQAAMARVAALESAAQPSGAPTASPAAPATASPPSAGRGRKARARATTPSARTAGTTKAKRSPAHSATAPMSAAPTTNPM